MIAWWTSPDWLVKHTEGQRKKAKMGGASHRQGSRSLALCIDDEVSKCILYSCFPCYFLLRKIVSFSPRCSTSILQEAKKGAPAGIFPTWRQFRTVEKDDPEKGLVAGEWLNTCAPVKASLYTSKLKELEGPEADPDTAVSSS